MNTDFIYDIMRSEEIREYYRKNIIFNTQEQISIIINCYKPIKEQLELLIKLENNIPDEDKNMVSNMISLYQLINKIYYNPYDFFDDDCRIIYVLHTLECKYNISSDIELIGFFKSYSKYVEYFDSLDEVIENMKENLDYINSYELEIVVIPKDNKLQYPISFYCDYIDNKFEPFRCVFIDELFDNYKLEESISIIKSSNTLVSHKGLPFNDNCIVRFQTPIMEQPFYGVLRSEKDGNGDWYHFMYKINNIELDTDFLDMSYINLDMTSKYAIFDWLERA